MPFRDGYPTDIEFEIDRGALLRYLRIQAFVGCCCATVPFALVATAYFDTHFRVRTMINVPPSFSDVMVNVMVGLTTVLVVGGAIYFAWFHQNTKRESANLRLLIEGPYLRIVSGGFITVDRRIHFRDIGDYSTRVGPLLRLMGLKALSFRLVGDRQHSLQNIVGLVDAQQARDQLCDIDAARETH